MNDIEQIYQNSDTRYEYADAYLSHLSKLLSELDRQEIAKVIELFEKAREEERTVFFIGNGGSAATASHFANDLAIGTRSKKMPFRVMSLTDNNAVMTAIGNDFGYDFLFVKQLEAIYREEDLLVAISASGNSQNLIKAIEYVKERKGTTIGLTGFDGGKLKEVADYGVHVQTKQGEYGPVEDIHMVLDHVIGTYLMYQCRQEA
jgi:D-sedoheptulose 7-phosphate isomerase